MQHLFLICKFQWQAECYHYLFDAAIKLHQLGLDWSTPNHGVIRNVNGDLKAGSLNLDYAIKPAKVFLTNTLFYNL